MPVPYEIKSLAELINKIEELQIPVEDLLEERCGTKWEQEAASFYEMGLDELDVIGVVMEIEDKFGLNVWDYVVEDMFGIKPDLLVAGRRRNDRLRDLGI